MDKVNETAQALYDHAVDNALVSPIPMWIALGKALYGETHPTVLQLEEMQRTGNPGMSKNLRNALYGEDPT